MEYILSALSYSMVFSAALAMAGIVVAIGVLSINRPSIVVYPILILLYIKSEISYGDVDATGGSLYSRGAGVMVFPFLIWSMIASLLWVYFARFFLPKKPAIKAPNLNFAFLVLLGLLIAHSIVAAFIGESVRDALSPAGFSNVLILWLFLLIIVLVIKTDSDVNLLLNFILFAGFARAVFGLGRFLFFGGDPVNAYANRHGLDIKLTFFDVSDGVICALSMFVAVTGLAFPGGGSSDLRLSRQRSIFLWLVLFVSMACILLSFRRAALFGLILSGIFFMQYLPSRVKWASITLGVPAVIFAGSLAAYKRLMQTRGASGLSDIVFDVMPTNVGPESSRLLELRLAWASFIDNPIFGVGAWGSYKGWQQISWQSGDGGGGLYLHSGLFHIALKTGVVGVIVISFIVGLVVVHWLRFGGRLNHKYRMLGVCGISGCLFMVPDFLFEPSITKYRFTLLWGFCLALPYVAYRMDCRWHVSNKSVVSV